MNEINKTNLSEHKKLRLSELAKIENYFNQEINQRKIMLSNQIKLNKYVTTFYYIIKVLSFSLTTGISKKLPGITRNKKKKYNKILVLAKSKLNGIEPLVSQALIDLEISHEEFNAITREKQKYERMKENVMNVSGKEENMRLNSVHSIEIASL